MRVSAKYLFEKAYGKFCIPAINISNPEQVHGLFSAAQKFQAPFIVQTTPAAREYAHPTMLLNYIKAAAKIYPDVVYAVHIDHGFESHIYDAINSGEYTSVMIDASHDTIEKNIERTKAIIALAHPKNISVEAELGVLSGVEDDLDIDEENALYTDPSDVEYFVKKTNCDSLAVAVGTSHGAYKFSGGKGLRFDLLEEIQIKLPKFPIVLHGASTVDLEEVKRINNAGGGLQNNAKGVSEDEVKRAISYGVCKLNIATDLRLLWLRIFREFFRDHNGEWDHLKPGKQYMQEIEHLLEQKFKMLGNKGKAHLYK
ncbi:class II fructose-bisphosphate aldolase [Mariniflexile sp.]|uniref:class II fructose-bisphosphate aldolase n=1 Tax=Mariniflexile sp. TaxID=1979402 RepID=UPI00404858F5